MTVRIDGNRILLEGDCTVEEAEILVGYLQETELALVDISHCRLAHTAIVQALLVFGPELLGESPEPFLRDRLTPALNAARDGVADRVGSISANAGDTDGSPLQGERQ